MTKYRIRLANGRVIGPFEISQIIELKTKGRILGDEEAQVFPAGNWAALKSFDFYPDLMDENKTRMNETPKEDTFIIDLGSLRGKLNELEIDEIENNDAPIIDNLTETVRFSNSEVKKNIVEKKEEASGLDINFPTKSLELDIGDLDEHRDSYDKTLINPIAQEEIQRMNRMKIQAEKEQKLQEEREKQQQALIKLKEEEELEEEFHPPEIVSSTDTTQMFKLETVKSELLSSAKEEEALIEAEIKKFELERRAEDEDEDQEEEESRGADKAKKKKIFIVLGALALLYVVLFPGEDDSKKKTFENLAPQVVFPIPFDKADSKASQVQYKKGLEHFNTGTYPGIVKAGLSFKSSYENDLSNIMALSYMVRSYGEELAYSSDKLNDTVTLFNVIKSKKSFLQQDPNGVIGLNLFYMANNKTEAAVDVVARYLKINPKNVTQDLFATYLLSLIKLGKIDVAKQFYVALEKAPEKTHYTYKALIEYLQLNQENEKAMEYVNDGIKRFPRNVQLLLLKADLLLQDKKFEDVPTLLERATELKLDHNNMNRAKFWELSGLYWAFKGDTKKATEFLTNSLRLRDSNTLRMKLAELTTQGNSPDTDKLISESKAFKLLSQAKDFYQKRNYELALSSAAKATDASPGNIPAELFLAKMQLKLGLAKFAFKTLNDLIQKYPDNKDINLALIDAYIDTYKFNDARTRISIISGTEIRNSWEYASSNGRLYLKMGDTLKAVSWLQTATQINPLNDYDTYLLAEVLLKRSNFDQARTLLNTTMELDPVNADYRIAYARMIYETQDDQAAIGYLLGLLNEFVENPKFLSEIAIFYFRAGKVKDFQSYKARLEKLPNKDKALYEFLIKSALLDERYNEIPVYVEELLKIEPGELESMMTAGRVMFETGKLIEAAKWFRRIQEKLPSYPKVQYYIARIKFLSRDFDGAQKEAENDIKDNGESDTTLVLLGEIYVQKGDLITAENTYKKAQKINPRSYDALMGLAELSTMRNNYDLALDLYKKAMNLKSDEAIVHKKIGDVYRLLGQGTLAIESYRMYLEMNPDASDKAQIDSYIQLMQ